jgi:transcriptional regulator with XRE-family HTH domain
MTGEFPPRSGPNGRLLANKAVGRKLHVARTQLAASEDFVAAALGLSIETYRAVEAGTAPLSPGHVIQAAQLFGLQPSVLCIDTDVPAAEPFAPRPMPPADVIDLAAARKRRGS